MNSGRIMFGNTGYLLQRGQAMIIEIRVSMERTVKKSLCRLFGMHQKPIEKADRHKRISNLSFWDYLRLTKVS